MSQLEVLLSVPHGGKGNDVIAPEVARSLFEMLKRDGFNVALVLSPADRLDVVDMNRPQSRDSMFRQELAKFLEQRPRLHLDIHSFPKYYPLYEGQDVVLLHTPELQDEAWLHHYSRLLVRGATELGFRGFSVMVAPHQHVDDVVAHGVELGVGRDCNMLAEHNESAEAALLALAHRWAIDHVFRERGWR